MSYDIYFNVPACPTCGVSDGPSDLPNPTYNLTEIFDLALTGESLPNADVAEVDVVLFKRPTDRPRGLRVLSGRTGADTGEQISAALNRMLDPAMRAQFQALEPENGWGTLDGAVRVMTTLHETAKRWPTGVWEIR